MGLTPSSTAPMPKCLKSPRVHNVSPTALYDIKFITKLTSVHAMTTSLTGGGSDCCCLIFPAVASTLVDEHFLK
jgi:hypothetical protein